MNPASRKTTSLEDDLEPTWEVAHLFPFQGAWTVEEYLDLPTNHLVEFSNGRLEVLPMPTTSHQLLVASLYGLLLAFVTARDLGTVLFAGLPVRIGPRKFREPDILFMRKEHAGRIGEKFWKGADLVMEVVSPDPKSRQRDLEKKRLDYALAGIPEYWIVDPAEERITVLRLVGKVYRVHGEFPRGMTATSFLLPGFVVDVTRVLDQKIPGTTRRTRKPKGPAPS